MSAKKCVKCGEWKSFGDFYAQKEMRDGYRNDCKSCVSVARRERYKRDPQRFIERTQLWKERNPEKYREMLRRNRTKNRVRRAEANRRAYLKRKYGLSVDDYEFLNVVQSYRCAICGGVSEALHVDHEHETAIVRGLLCGNCNKAIGLFHEDPSGSTPPSGIFGGRS